jgi:hypothetical protein
LRICVQLAHSKEEYEAAFRLMQDGRRQWKADDKDDDLWVLKQHALPSTNTIVAIVDGEVVGALSLFGENAFRLPFEESGSLDSLRESLDGRLAEFSLPGIKTGPHSQDILFALYYFGLCFGSSYCHYDAFVTNVPAGWAKLNAESLGYDPLPIKEMAGFKPLFRGIGDSADLRRFFSPDFTAEFRFPERRFFLVAHQSIEPQTLHYLFNERTKLFQNLSDIELRVLKNFYDYGEFAGVLPDRKLNLPFKRLPKHRRFPMNCEGYLSTGDGRKSHLQVLDVSREGIKIKLGDHLPEGTYPLNLSIGVRKQAEIIASTIWIDELAQIAGLIVTSGDKHWEELIEYLERESLRSVA